MSKKTTAKAEDNVIQMPNNDADAALTLIHLRAFAGLRALDKVLDKVRAELKRASDEWKVALNKATDEYRGPIREHLESIADYDPTVKTKAMKAKTELYATKFVDVGHGLEHYDEIKSASDADKAAKNIVIKRLEDASRECMGVARNSSKQGDLFGSVDTGVPSGMSWATPATSEAIYTSMLRLQVDRYEFDPFQEALFVDLGSSGLESFDLGLDASEAIEEDAGTEAPPDEDEDDDEQGF